jgi:hypothetical protein
LNSRRRSAAGLSCGFGFVIPNHPVQILPQLRRFWPVWRFVFGQNCTVSQDFEAFMAKANPKSGVNVFKICN